MYEIIIVIRIAIAVSVVHIMDFTTHRERRKNPHSEIAGKSIPFFQLVAAQTKIALCLCMVILFYQKAFKGIYMLIENEGCYLT